MHLGRWARPGFRCCTSSYFRAHSRLGNPGHDPHVLLFGEGNGEDVVDDGAGVYGKFDGWSNWWATRKLAWWTRALQRQVCGGQLAPGVRTMCNRRGLVE
ncbi:hypothetical protein COP1_022484 [Malus domestica]